MVLQLSVGEVAALINIGLVIVQVTYPLLVAFITVGILRNRTNVATWSVFGHLINESFWPTLLSTDTASREKVDKRIWSISWFSTFAAVLLGVSAAITPLGLHTKLQASQPKDTLFSYMKDESPIGQGTPPRDGYDFNRLCGNGACPGNQQGTSYMRSTNSTAKLINSPYVTNKIATNITNAFSDSGDASTITGFFDINYRDFLKTSGTLTGQFFSALKNKTFTTGLYSYYQQFLLNSKIEVVEGLIVSTLNPPGIGFRNHSMPPEAKDGYEWTEEILWLEPETACTNLNITFDYTVISSTWSVMSDALLSDNDARIVDQGGLRNLPDAAPEMGHDDMQEDPQLLRRSWIGATYTIEVLATFLNRTNASSSSTRYYFLRDTPLFTDSYGSFDPAPNQIDLHTYGRIGPGTRNPNPGLPGPLTAFSSTKFGEYNIENSIMPYALYPSPNSSNAQDISKVAIRGGLMLGVGQTVGDDGRVRSQLSGLRLRPGSKYSHPIYSCVTAIKASIRTVHFRARGHSVLSNLDIQSIGPSESTKPLWVVEKSGWDIAELDPLWGIAHPHLRESPSLSLLNRSHLFLPAGTSVLAPFSPPSTLDSIAASTAPLLALKSIYEYTSPDGWSDLPLPDYKAKSNWPMLMRWSRLTQDASTAGQVYNLMWTDIMANLVVGIKGVMQSSSKSSGMQKASRVVEVVVYDWRYAALIFCFAAIYLGLFLWSVLLLALKKCSLATLHFMLDQTAAGRSITTERFNGDPAKDYAKTKQWAQQRGHELVYVSKPDILGTRRAKTEYRMVGQRDEKRGQRYSEL